MPIGSDLARPAGCVAFMSGYLVSQVEVLGAEAWEAYRSRAAPAIAAFAGRGDSCSPPASAIKPPGDPRGKLLRTLTPPRP
jgi:hypothetical protein